MDETGFQTLVGIGAASGDVPSVGIIKKRPGRNAFSHMVTIGRASNNDIEIKSPGISKFHAFVNVLPSPTGELMLTDAGTTNGTVVGNEKLKPRTPTVLRCGVDVEFATVRAKFLDAESFHRWLLQTGGQSLL